MPNRKYDVTIVIPSHNRHNYLDRSARFFSNLFADVIFCDSSEERYTGELGPNSSYYHLPGLTFIDKIIYAIEHASTSYIACCADDDFILHTAIYEGVEFLSKRNDFKAFIGRYLGFNYNDIKMFDRYGYRGEIISSHQPKVRAIKLFTNYKIMLWGLHERSTLLEAYQIIKNSAISNDNFIEFVIAAIACARGKIKVTDTYWGVREVNPGDHWGQRHKPLIHIFSDAKIREDFNHVKYHLDRATEVGYAFTAFLSYLIFCTKLYFRHNFILTRLLNRLRKILGVTIKSPEINANEAQMAELSKIQKLLGEAI